MKIINTGDVKKGEYEYMTINILDLEGRELVDTIDDNKSIHLILRRRIKNAVPNSRTTQNEGKNITNNI